MSKGIVLWNAREAKDKCEQFAKSYAQLRGDLLDHLEHKGHVALKYSDDWDGFFSYCREKLKLELSTKTIQLQIATAQVSREVGVEVPMVISRQLAKLPPEKQKGVYDEVIGAREVAGQRSANQMEPDVRKVVRREMGIEEKPAPEQSVVTDDAPRITAYDEQLANVEPISPETAEAFRNGPWENAQDAETVNRPPDEIDILMSQYNTAIGLICEFINAYGQNSQEDMLITYTAARKFIDAL